MMILGSIPIHNRTLLPDNFAYTLLHVNTEANNVTDSSGAVMPARR